MKISTEKKVVDKMIRLYCRLHKHSTGEGLCKECEELLKYSHERLDRCHLKDEKGACKDCRIHCYNSYMRGRIREVMRYMGPRIIFYHPLLAIRHLLNK